MNTIRKEVRELISVSERIQSAMQKGDQLTDDENGLVEMCASELLACRRVIKAGLPKPSST